MSAEPNQNGKLTLLVVDDEPGVRLAMEYALGGRFRVVSEASGAAAIERVKAEPVDGILIDVNMPRMSGFEAVEQIRALGFRIPVWFMTAVVPTAVVERADEMEARGIFRKPFDVLKLRAELEPIYSGAPRPPVMTVCT